MIVLNHRPFQKHQKPTLAVAADLKMSNQAKPAGNRSYYAIGGPLFNYTVSHFIRWTCSVAKKGDYMPLNVAWLLVPDGLVWLSQKLLISWDFHASLWFPKKRKYPVSGSRVEGNGLKRWEVGGDWCRLVLDDRKVIVGYMATMFVIYFIWVYVSPDQEAIRFGKSHKRHLGLPLVNMSHLQTLNRCQPDAAWAQLN